MKRGRQDRLAVIGLRGVPDVIGGVETHCALLYPALARQMPELGITLLARRRYVRAPRFMFQGVEVRALRSLTGAASETLVHSLCALLYARLVLGARLVHLHGIGPGFFAPLARLLGMRVVVTDHANDYERPKWGALGRTFLRWGERLSTRFADRFICVSEALHRDVLSRIPDVGPRVALIRHGARLPASKPAEDAAYLAGLGITPGRYVLTVSRLEETKRIEDVIAAHVQTGPDRLPLVIVGASLGDDAYEQRLRAAAGQDVIFAGFCCGPLLTALFRQAALLVHASAMEGFGLVLLEALGAGTRVAASDIPVHREFGLPDDCYFPVGDVDDMRQIIAATPPRNGDWPPASAIAGRYSLDASVRDHAELFRGLLRPVTAGQVRSTARPSRASISDQ